MPPSPLEKANFGVSSIYRNEALLKAIIQLQTDFTAINSGSDLTKPSPAGKVADALTLANYRLNSYSG